MFYFCFRQFRRRVSFSIQAILSLRRERWNEKRTSMCSVHVKLRISDFRISHFIIRFFFLIKDRSSDWCGWRKIFLLNTDSRSLSCFKKKDLLLHRFLRSRKFRDGMNVLGWILVHKRAFSCDGRWWVYFDSAFLLNGSVHVSILLQNPE